MESRFGYDFGSVRIHDDVIAAASASAVDARAYTVGNHIVFDRHESPQGSQTKHRLLAHELAHVVQQNRHGSTSPSPDPSSRIERDADRAATNIMQSTGPVTVNEASAVGLAREKKKPKGEAAADPAVLEATKGPHRLHVRVVRFGKTVMEFHEVSGGMTPVDKAMPKRFGEWAVHTEPKAMVRIYNSGIPLDRNTSIFMKGVLNPCSHCDRFLNQIAEKHEVLIQYEWKYAKRNKAMRAEKGKWQFHPDRLWKNLRPKKGEAIPELVDMAQYSRDAGRGPNEKGRQAKPSKRLQRAKGRSGRKQRSRKFKQGLQRLTTEKTPTQKESKPKSQGALKKAQKRAAKTKRGQAFRKRAGERARFGLLKKSAQSSIGLKAAGTGAVLAGMELTTTFANQQQSAAVRTELLRIGPQVRELRRNHPDRWIVVYGSFVVPPQERNPQLQQGAISPAAKFHDSSIIIADSLADAQTNQRPQPPDAKFELRIISQHPPLNDSGSNSSPEASDTVFVVDGPNTLVGILAALSPWDRPLFLDSFKQASRGDWPDAGITSGYKVRYGSLVLWMSAPNYRLAKTAVEVATIEYVDERLRFIGDYERKVNKRWSRLRGQNVVRKLWQSSVLDIDEAPKNAMAKSSELRKNGWKWLRERSYHKAKDATEQAESELDAVWDALDQYELNMIGGFRARPTGPYAGYHFHKSNEEKLGSAVWLVGKAKRTLAAQNPVNVVSATTIKPKPHKDLFEDKNRVLAFARRIRNKGEGATVEEKIAAREELWRVIGRIELKMKHSLINEEIMGLGDWKSELLSEVSKLSGTN